MPKRMQDLPVEYGSTQRALAQAIGGRIRLRRTQLELTQEQVRTRLEFEHVFVSRTQFSRIENGEALLDAAEIVALQKTLGVSFDWLLEGRERERGKTD